MSKDDKRQGQTKPAGTPQPTVLRKVDPEQIPPPLNRAERRLMKKLKKRS